jgi:hypothetical protein
LPLLPWGAGGHGWLSGHSDFRRVLETQPVRDLLRIETNRAPYVKARQLSTSSHPIDVLVVNAKKFAKF